MGLPSIVLKATRMFARPGGPGFHLQALYGCASSSTTAQGRRKRSPSKIKPPLDELRFNSALSRIPPRFRQEEFCDVLTSENDPVVCLELFNWATQQPRFKHDASTYHLTIKKLGASKLYREMDDIVTQVLALGDVSSEPLFNSMIYFFTEAGRLTRAVTVFRHMRVSGCTPTIRTYNLLFAAFTCRDTNSYINHLHMETTRYLFRRMMDDGVDPDIFTLNSMIKGYVISMHVNDALRIFHQMGVVYKDPLPNSLTYDYLIHGLCAQGRTKNALELFDQMKASGFLPSRKSYNSIINALAITGETEKAVCFLREMIEKRRRADLITYRTVLDEMCRHGQSKNAFLLLQEWMENDLVPMDAYKKLVYVLQDDYGHSNTDWRNR